MKKVLFFLTDVTNGGGVQRVTSVITNNLSEDIDITILSLFSSNDIPVFEFNSNIHINSLFKEQFDLKKNMFKVIKSLRKYFKSNQDFDILISDGIGLSTFLMFGSIGLNVERIAWEHQCYLFGKKFGLEWLGKQIAGHFFDKIITITKRDFELYSSKHFKAKIYQIYNPNEIRKKKSADLSKKRIISVGSLNSQKGFDFAIEIAKRIFSFHPDWTWDIWGTGKDKDILLSLINQYRLLDNVYLKGYNSNIYDEYENYSIYAMTSRHEGLGMVLLEASSVGLPMISFDINCGPNEIIIDNESGYLIESFDLDSYSKKIMKMMSDENLREALSRVSKLEKKEFSLDYVIRSWKNILGVIHYYD